MASKADNQAPQLKFLWWNLEHVPMPRTLRAVIRSKTAILGIFFVSIALLAAVMTFERVSMEIVILLALAAAGASFVLNWYIGGAKKKSGDTPTDKPS